MGEVGKSLLASPGRPKEQMWTRYIYEERRSDSLLPSLSRSRGIKSQRGEDAKTSYGKINLSSTLPEEKPKHI